MYSQYDSVFKTEKHFRLIVIAFFSIKQKILSPHILTAVLKYLIKILEHQSEHKLLNIK